MQLPFFLQQEFIFMIRFLVFAGVISMLLIGCPVKDSVEGVVTPVQPVPTEPAGDTKELPVPDAVEDKGDTVIPEEDQTVDGGDIGC